MTLLAGPFSYDVNSSRSGVRGFEVNWIEQLFEGGWQDSLFSGC